MLMKLWEGHMLNIANRGRRVRWTVAGLATQIGLNLITK
jgi:hypothetical protein